MKDKLELKQKAPKSVRFRYWAPPSPMPHELQHPVKLNPESEDPLQGLTLPLTAWGRQLPLGVLSVRFLGAADLVSICSRVLLGEQTRSESNPQPCKPLPRRSHGILIGAS